MSYDDLTNRGNKLIISPLSSPVQQCRITCSHRQKKLDTSLNRRKIKSIKDSTDLKIGNTAEIHKNYFGVHNIMIGPLLHIGPPMITVLK